MTSNIIDNILSLFAKHKITKVNLEKSEQRKERVIKNENKIKSKSEFYLLLKTCRMRWFLCYISCE